MLYSREIYGDILVELGGERKEIVVLDCDLSGSTRTKKFALAFPDRFFNMGVSEQDMVGTAVGLALSGKVPFASTFAIFETGRAWEQIRQSVCYPRLNVKLVASHGGITVGPDGASHQSLEDIAIMRVLPNMTIIVPADGVETGLVVKAVSEYEGPVYVRLNRNKTPVIYDENHSFKLGKSDILREGKDAAIIAAGIMVYYSLEASKQLASEGIEASVINMSTIKPIDKEIIIKSAMESKAIVTVEEHSVIGGLGGAVAEVLCENYPVPLKRIGINDKFGMSGKAEELLKLYGLSVEDIAAGVKEVIKKKR
ncbi:MAG: transketolase family protein [Nitrospirota bacterium]